MKEVLSSATLRFCITSLFHIFKNSSTTQMSRQFVRESAILPFEFTLKVAHLADADGTPILLDGFVNQGESRPMPNR
jgi:hypothetical protein